jgi:septum site-determining protein MinC
MLKPLKLLPEVSPPFELKGSLFTLTVLHLHEANHEIIARYLVEKIRQAPGFFRNTPVVVDLEALTEADADVDFISLSGLLRTQGLVPVGVRNGSPALQAAAVLAGLPVLPDGRSAAAVKKLDKPEHYPPVGCSKIITQPVRSGQQIYAADGDLILLGAISAGAEVLADGNIHSYGPLRGRALAGVKGDTEARIFCQSLAAELVSIAGHYRIIEQLDEAEQGKPVQLYLSEDHLIIEPLLR